MVVKVAVPPGHTMDLAAFTTRIPASARARLSNVTLERWSAIHAYVVEHGQTDRYDRALRQHVQKACGKWITEETMQRHLKRMTDAKLLQAHPLLVKPNALGKLFGSFSKLDFVTQAVYTAK